MPCTQCNGEGEDNRSYDRIHEQKELSMGAGVGHHAARRVARWYTSRLKA